MKNELGYLEMYMHIYIELLPYCYGENKRLNKKQLPSFEYYKQTMNDPRYSLIIPRFIEGYTITKEGRIVKNPCQGIESREYTPLYYHINYWLGCKFYLSKLRINSSAVLPQFEKYINKK